MSEDKSKISDGYHTFEELYEHRHALFISLVLDNPEKSWISKFHDDGSSYDGWFIAGMVLPTGNISYHLPISKWELLDNGKIRKLDKAPKFDGHTANDVIERLNKWNFYKNYYLGPVYEDHKERETAKGFK